MSESSKKANNEFNRFAEQFIDRAMIHMSVGDLNEIEHPAMESDGKVFENLIINDRRREREQKMFTLLTQFVG